MRRKDFERKRARELRREGRSLREIARALDVSLSSASVWVRDVPRGGVPREPAPIENSAPPAGDEPLRRCGKCKKELPESAFNHHPKGRQWWCRECFRAYFRKRGDLHRRQSGASRERRQAKARTLIRTYLSTHPCVDCGEGDTEVLEFDHIGEKTEYISKLVHNGARIAAIEEEIRQCEVVCASCHRIRTAQRAGWLRAKKRWWREKRPTRSYAAARNLAYVYSYLERSECVDCGRNDMCVLEFDHVSSKRAAVGVMARNEVGLERLKEEISRCEVRCANCHRRRSLRIQRMAA